MWICDSYYIKNNKLIVSAINSKNGKRKNATGPGINLNFDWLYRKEDFEKNFESDLNFCLSKWDGKQTIGTELKKLLSKKYGYKIEESIYDIESLFEEKKGKLNLEINEKVFEYYKDFFEVYDESHKFLLDKGMELFNLYIHDDYFKDIIDKISFSGGTSLLYKYKNFYRFSKDLDFQLELNMTKEEEYKIKDLFKRIFTSLLNFILDNKDWFVEDDSGVHKEIIFVGKDGKKRNIKIDYIKFSGVAYETLSVNGNLFKKLSDLDILCNKLLRLKEIDICDITFLLIKHNFSKKDLIKTIEQKSLEIYGDKDEIFIRKKQDWKEKGKKDLPFLKNLI